MEISRSRPHPKKNMRNVNFFLAGLLESYISSIRNASPPQIMDTPNIEKQKQSNGKSVLSVRVNLDQILDENELASFQEQAEKAGRTVREHFIAITIGKPETSAA
jgi:hypothetical protein